uniref:ParB N-terminal domain-containing protein n=1 Tax=Chamaesiphon sp. OTE_20_metabat_361 TaxID=2964689 RepID=UPI00286B1FA8
MIKCYFVDVKSISSTVSKSKFKKAEIDRLADAMLAADGLLRPLILQQTGVEKYTVIEGHREYYAAVRAKEKDIRKAEMVNAFVIDANSHKSAIDQLKLFTPQSASESLTPDTAPDLLTDIIAASIDRLLPEITAAISTQLQPIVSQLANHQQILDTIASALATKPKDESGKQIQAEEKKLLSIVDLPEQEVKPVVDSQPKIERKKKSESVETLGSDSPEPKPTKATKTTPRSSKKTKAADTSASIPVAIEPQAQTTATILVPKTTKSAETKPAATGVSTGSDKATLALDLINHLNQDELMVKIERSSVKITRDIVESIILKRASQPAQKFASWDDLS